jgi:prepilin-type N-terminal cleavage/methylation domain-containing protein
MRIAKPTGYTIVELLIVIVVIGILATIAFIAYNGISGRAEDSVVTSKVQSIVKLLEAYGAANGGHVPQADWACVGEPDDFPAENGYTAEWCGQPSQAAPIPASNPHPVSSSLNTKLKTLVNRVPSGRIPEVDEGGGVKDRGIYYDSSATQNGGKPILQFIIKRDRTSCPIGIRTWSTTDYTICEYRFTSITSETGN